MTWIRHSTSGPIMLSWREFKSWCKGNTELYRYECCTYEFKSYPLRWASTSLGISSFVIKYFITIILPLSIPGGGSLVRAVSGQQHQQQHQQQPGTAAAPAVVPGCCCPKINLPVPTYIYNNQYQVVDRWSGSAQDSNSNISNSISSSQEQQQQLLLKLEDDLLKNLSSGRKWTQSLKIFTLRYGSLLSLFMGCNKSKCS